MSGTTPFDCPRCGVSLAMSERQGIEIDYCRQCRGELDKIIERTAGAREPAADQPAAGGWTRPTAPSPQWRQPSSEGQHGHGYGHGGKKRKSWLEEIFD